MTNGSQRNQQRYVRLVFEQASMQFGRILLQRRALAVLGRRAVKTRRQRADEYERDVPVAALDHATLDGLGDWRDDITQPVALAMIRPQCEKQAFRIHYAIRSRMPCNA